MHPLRTYLESTGTTLEAFAESVGVSRMTLYRAMRGETSLPVIRKIVAETGGAITANDFLQPVEAAE